MIEQEGKLGGWQRISGASAGPWLGKDGGTYAIGFTLFSGWASELTSIITIGTLFTCWNSVLWVQGVEAGQVDLGISPVLLE
jgi:hypothetical protein